VQRASGIPCALCFEEGGEFINTSGAMRRELLMHVCFALTLIWEVRRDDGVARIEPNMLNAT
jgi:hypothetical protein